MTNTNFYDELRAKLHQWASSKEGLKSRWVDYVLFLPDFGYLIGGLLLDPEIPAKYKAKLGMVIAYIINPLDLVPEAIIGPVGYVDDLALAAYVINQLLNNVDNTIVLRHWKGDGDLLEIVRHIIKVTDEMVGSGLWQRLKAMFGTK